MPRKTMTRMRFRVLLVLLAVFWGGATARAADCTPSSLSQVTVLLEQARQKIYLVKYDESLEKLTSAESMLPCLTETIPRESLSHLYLLQGVAAFLKGDESGATESFRKAVAIDRGTRWDEKFGQRPREVFVEAKEAALMAPKAQVRIPELKSRVLVYFDGEPNASGASLQLLPGRHFMQIKADDRIAGNVFVDVAAGREMLAPVPPEYVRSTPVAAHETSGSTEANTGTSVKSETPAKVPEPKEERPPFDKTRLRMPSYVVMGVGGAALVSAGAFGVLTFLTSKELRDNCYANRDTCTDGSDKQTLFDKQRTTALITDASLGAAVLFGGVGATLYLLSRPADSTASMAGLYPWATLSSVGLGWHGSF